MIFGIRNRVLSAGIAFICVVAGISVFLSRAPRAVAEPVYGGRTVSDWLYQLSQGAPEQAGGAFRELGKEAVPFLLDQLKRNRVSPVDRIYGAAWRRLPLKISSRLPRPRFRENHLPDTAAVAFSHIGRAAIPQLLQAVDDPDPGVRIAVLNGIRFLAMTGEMEAFTEDAVSKINRLIGSNQRLEVRSAAEDALKELDAVDR